MKNSRKSNDGDGTENNSALSLLIKIMAIGFIVSSVLKTCFPYANY